MNQKIGPGCSEAGRGPLVVLLHAFPLDHRMWDSTVEALSGSFHLIAPDLPGAGSNPPEGNPGDLSSIEAMAEGVAAWLLDRNLVPHAVAGCSMGGYVALALADLHPALVPRLALIDSRARADSQEERSNRLQLAEDLLTAGPGWTTLLAERMVPRLLTPKAPPQIVSEVQRWIAEGSVTGARAALRAMASRPDRTALLTRFPGPFLALSGAEDSLIPPEETAALARLAPRGNLAIVPQAGHLPHLEQPADCHRSLTAWLLEP